MKNDLTDITLVVDRSGSMASCRDDAEGGINHFIEEQKAAPGEANFTLVQFDSEYEFVHKGASIKDVGRYSLTPRGSTALLDAVGRAIAETGERLDKLSQESRPAAVVFVIVTDGHENASREFTKAKVRESIQHQRDKYNWQFTFIGADASAFDEGAAMGISADAIARSSSQGQAYRTSSDKVRKLRASVASGDSASFSYSDEDRKAMS